jgi:hypothetical protein
VRFDSSPENENEGEGEVEREDKDESKSAGQETIWECRFAAKGEILAVTNDRLAGMWVEGSDPDAVKEEKLSVVRMAEITVGMVMETEDKERWVGQ